ncbi:hypothetical protein RRU94_01840 [Domibacillus sp. DTU_2020_1001157_1_SI_ALB_TIR_016]|uniref:hypothetical protein n=1 Tax=Domibacillus sp. DTU_2020_1001157_1_SI_ALB_TIR_016 TaxID=3077789 RepID=UPI0028F11990|nr:hypothetical protein [Domibacillus sp. DTU_2020_1001157_1_SI_ALB_TIR_016]WNS78715.1 hypothetical protein RRU94_01840 [Domibacillus sp. DTU_2020_1001157_1_SI_ALB_TIR_016]
MSNDATTVEVSKMLCIVAWYFLPARKNNKQQKGIYIMRIYQLYSVLNGENHYTTYVGTDREVAFSSGGNNSRIRVWIHGTYVEDYSYESGKWALIHDRTKEIEEGFERMKEDEEKTQQRLENIRKALADYEQMFAVLKAE